ncbi:TPA: hypothetical protein QEL68_000750 [Stenotrophomonas maltophilia]|nr:hypothetical protein [Stenotrophomonas maltophilia]
MNENLVSALRNMADDIGNIGASPFTVDLTLIQLAIAALTPPGGSDQSLLELAATFETCIPFLPSAGQRNIGKAVAQLRHMAMGYVLVPVEPTDDMVWAPSDVEVGYPTWAGSRDGCTTDEAKAIWAAMLAARPEVKA